MRRQMVERLKDTTHLRAYQHEAQQDPCQRAMAREMRANPDALTTVYCPGVQFHLPEEENWDMDYLQILMPLDSIPNSVEKYEAYPRENYMLELLCKVNDARVVKGEDAEDRSNG